MGERTWPQLLAALLRGDELSTADTAWAMGEIMSGSAGSAQIAGFAIALRAKGETPAEVSGLVEAMLQHAVRVELPEDLRATAVDVVGTGGDLAHTVNISTMASLVVAGAGVRVVKHGNRAASSSCGTADVLEFLGLPLDLGPEGVAACVAEAGIGFCFAARFHPGMRHAGPVRRELGVPTAFNFLGPLTNPARPRAGAVGCFDARMAPVMAAVFAARGDSTLVLRGEDGLDEFTTAAPTRVWAAQNGTVREALLDAADLGVPRATLADLRGGDVACNADAVRRLLAGETGPIRDAVLVNAAAALATQAPLDGDLTEALRTGLSRAAESIDSGAAARTLNRWIEVAHAVRPVLG
ncbi:anthranilate phosphoribosyltransferase [Salinispora arenicola]|uniref:Anthranilate phosphoribosyltransferase n=2 Tax=Salinispora arenicola TaxID=168697 RepID=TRPD_SALAI|nr:anthranilate phosphoribosyltransferase [Salinispora arenicola]A8LYC4.1 RecName: Full=Anthranilate phosphoribosyltransferase [Salinispora arenicola CNS-205]MCN0151323.1 anthranilate phosphoribosyltransferase [Salinispora arenicola]NIL40410.1 anthranilate phosphoribosyltransferase [Salinispora arenicola]TQL37702.1 anthranilate phosphoribosyltransferase [Salinispora arenicola]GIM86251.1 anthranilate phosphoribosyltransferase 1 [Salinispora arenicola]